MTTPRTGLSIPQQPSPWSRVGYWGVPLLLVLWSFSGVRRELGELFTAGSAIQMWAYVSKLWPPERSPEFLPLLAWASAETFAISVGGTALAAVIAAALLYFAASDDVLGAGGEQETSPARQASVRRLTYLLARTALNLMRTVPELVWAIFFVFAVGLGPFAGVLALGIHNGGVIGKLYAETLENVRRGPVEALRAGGARRASAFLYGALPQAWPQIVAYTLYRWEVNIRAAAILGFVGAGGLGQQMHIAISLFLESRLVTLIAAVFILVNAVDLMSGYLRRKWEAAF